MEPAPKGVLFCEVPGVKECSCPEHEKPHYHGHVADSDALKPAAAAGPGSLRQVSDAAGKKLGLGEMLQLKKTVSYNSEGAIDATAGGSAAASPTPLLTNG